MSVRVYSSVLLQVRVRIMVIVFENNGNDVVE
jgi:hypothetical protein